jgi:hypothetical protein
MLKGFDGKPPPAGLVPFNTSAVFPQTPVKSPKSIVVLRLRKIASPLPVLGLYGNCSVLFNAEFI